LDAEIYESEEEDWNAEGGFKDSERLGLYNDSAKLIIDQLRSDLKSQADIEGREKMMEAKFKGDDYWDWEKAKPFECVSCVHLAVEPYMCQKCKCILCKSCFGIGKQSCPNCKRESEFVELPRNMEAIYNRIEIRCPKCPKFRFKFKNRKSHFKKCKGLRFYQCNASLCSRKSSRPRFKTRRELLDNHWLHDCEALIQKCETCGCLANYKKHDCVKELKDSLCT